MKPLLAITMGDPAGIGPELCLKAALDDQIRAHARLRFYASTAILREHTDVMSVPARELPGVEIVDVGPPREPIAFGQVSGEAGRLSAECLDRAVADAISGGVDAIVTGPISKEAWRASGAGYPGHTEFLAARTETSDFGMLLVSEPLRILHLSTHCSLRQAIEVVREPRIIRMVRLLARTLAQMGIAEPRIAVAGLNPHAGEGGMFGDEEESIIRPAVEKLQQSGLDVEGPMVPDTLFARARTGEYDGILAMYHDQGHIALKTVMFEPGDPGRLRAVRGVNVTIGLPIIRTSVDHGVAFDIAGKGVASPDSLVDAALLAARMVRGRSVLTEPETN